MTSVGQSAFATAVLDPERPVPDGLSDPQGRPAGKRFDVYRNNVAVSLTEALETCFPVVRKLVGESNFKLLAGVYLRRKPPRSAILMLYGEDMPEFLESFEPVRRYPYLPDVARLELALRQSYHAADAEPLAPDVLQTLPAERLMTACLVFAPAVRLVRSRWPIHGIWRMNMEPGAPKPGSEGENVLVTRPEFDPVPTTLPPGGGTFVDALMDGRSLGAAFDAAMLRLPEFDLAATLAILIQGGALSGLSEGQLP